VHVGQGDPYITAVEFFDQLRERFSTLGVPSGAIGWVYGPQSGTDMVTSTLIVPLNGFATTTPLSRINLRPTWTSSGQAPPPGRTPARSERAPADDTWTVSLPILVAAGTGRLTHAG
jgi:hypothetical protein